MKNNLLQEAYRLRFQYYNVYEGKEDKWHIKFENHELYNIVKKSFQYDFKQIGEKMPKLLEEAM